MNLAHELPSIAEVESPEPEPRAHRRPFVKSWRVLKAEQHQDPAAFVPDWAKDSSLLPKKPPMARWGK